MKRAGILFFIMSLWTVSLPVFAFTGELSNLRDKRYCEVAVIHLKEDKLIASVYSTVNLNNCPAPLWDKLTVHGIRKQFDAFWVKLNGPRYWTLDGVIGQGNSTDGPLVNIGGIEFKQRANIESYIWKGMGRKLYTENVIHRDSIWIYNPHTEIYELIAPNGNVYVMQSYSQIVDSHLQMSDLKNLGQRLKLPKGWKYQVRQLNKKLEVKTLGTAYVLQDDLLNSYSRVLNPNEIQ